MAQSQLSKSQCLVHGDRGEADQKDRLNDAGYKADLEVGRRAHHAHRTPPRLPHGTCY